MAYLSMPFCALARSLARPSRNCSLPTKWKCYVWNCRSVVCLLFISPNATPIKIWLFVFNIFAHWLDGYISSVCFSRFFFICIRNAIKTDKKWDGSIVGKMFVICSLVALQFMRFLLHLPRFVRLQFVCICMGECVFFSLSLPLSVCVCLVCLHNAWQFGIIFYCWHQFSCMYLLCMSSPRTTNNIYKHRITVKIYSNTNRKKNNIAIVSLWKY